MLNKIKHLFLKKQLIVLFFLTMGLGLTFVLYPLHKLYKLMDVNKLNTLSTINLSFYVSDIVDQDNKETINKNLSKITPFSEISKYLIYSLICAEDVNFFNHNGFDFKQIKNSLKINLAKKSYHRGASTITQQLVKMVALQSDKTLLRKIREAIGAVLIEYFLSKEQIITWYLNLVYFGSNIYGIHQASSHYFNTTPDRLTISESVHLALILPGPNSWSESLKNKSLTNFGKKRFHKLLKELYNGEYITHRQYVSANKTGNFGNPVYHLAQTNH